VRSTTRREFLSTSGRVIVAGTGSLAFGSLVAACGLQSGDDSGTAGVSLPDDVQIVQRFPQNLVSGELRLPLSLASGGGLLTTDGPTKTPDVLTARILRIDGGRNDVVAEGLTALRHDAQLAMPYWPFFVNIEQAGFYRIVLDGGPSDGAVFQVFARGEVAVPGIGDALPALDTPTFDDDHGVDPICTWQPESCPLHEVTLTEALTLSPKIALLVGTPAHCTTGTCAPALEALVSVAARVGDTYTFIHAEVYADPDATQVAPVVTALGMNYEPALFVTDSRGVVTARLDGVFDEVELTELIG